MLTADLSTADPRIDATIDELGIDARILDGAPPPTARRTWYLPLKAAAEWSLALALFVMISPLVLLLAALVKLTSPGPALYAQTRLGRGGRLYRIFKLRTMRHNAEAGSGPVWAAKNDVRITPIGRFLRDSHLDELPQLWNVLRGEMSLIGPRPERPEIASRIATRVPHFYHRLQVRPGITGLSQMLLPADDPNDKNYECVRRKLAHDLVYVREVSPLMDLRLAMGTAIFFFGGPLSHLRRRVLNAYALPLDGAAGAAASMDLAEVEGRAA